ncbi:thioredoxin-like protein [Desulfobotulus alkaliphilus]|uniref:Thioredoxin-like protein n=2 Tax=Desulfobotulus alkaliphilus TaxID=622671 RepID=A0A562RRJ8_9BACT|nr:thioredoxin-like protein [Desulfobotulus alkaliphilus]
MEKDQGARDGRSSRGGLCIRLLGKGGSEHSVREYIDALLDRIKDGGRVFSGEQDDGCPGFSLEDRGLIFRGIPGKREEEILLDYLDGSDHGVFFVSDMGSPALLRLFVSGHCPHCPGALRMLLGFLNKGPVSLEVISVDHCPDMASDFQVMAVPTLMLAGKEDVFRWTGNLNGKDIENALCGMNPQLLSEESLLNILESGDAQRLVAMMQAEKVIFPAFYNLLIHEKWTVRLGAMVASESLILASPDLGEGLLDWIWERRETLDHAVLGDMVYLMGFGRPVLWKPRLASLMSSSGSDIRDAIEDAMAALEEASR